MRTRVAVLVASLVAACGGHEPAPAATPPRPPPPLKLKGRIASKPLFTFSAHDVPIVAIALSPDAHTLVTAGADEPTAKVWDLLGRKFRCDLRQPYPVTSIAISPDGKTIATGSASAKVGALGGATGPADLSFSTHGQLTLWDSASCKSTITPLTDARLVDAVAWSSDGKRLACVEGGARKVRVFDATKIVLVATFDVDAEEHTQLAFMPDGSALAVETEQGVTLWDLATGAQRASMPGATSSIALARDGSSIAAGTNGELRFYTATGDPLQTVHSLSDAENTLIFTEDSKRLVSGGEDGALHVWTVPDARSTETVRTSDAVVALAMSKDGSVLASASRDGNVGIWRME